MTARVSRWTLVALVVGMLAPVGDAAIPPNPEPPEVQDIAGDANGTLVDLDTRPASHAPLDLVGVDFATIHEARPVGEDGIDYVATGLRVEIQTLGSVLDAAAPSDLRALIGDGECFGAVEAVVVPSGWPLPDGRHLQAHWLPWGPCGPEKRVEPTWAVTLVEPTRVRIDVPFAGLVGAQASIIHDGSFLPEIGGQTALSRLPIAVETWGLEMDMAIGGWSFTIGEDVPEDVPCTRGCP